MIERAKRPPRWYGYPTTASSTVLCNPIRTPLTGGSCPALDDTCAMSCVLCNELDGMPHSERAAHGRAGSVRRL